MQRKELDALNKDSLINLEEAAAYLRLTKNWIYQNHKIENMPCFKLNHKLIFRICELDEWLESKRIA